MYICMGLDIRSPEGIRKPSFWSSASCELQRHICMLLMWPFTLYFIIFIMIHALMESKRAFIPTPHFHSYSKHRLEEKNHTILEPYNFSHEHHNYKL